MGRLQDKDGFAGLSCFAKMSKITAMTHLGRPYHIHGFIAGQKPRQPRMVNQSVLLLLMTACLPECDTRP